jgi:hypothetical protein
MEIRHKIRPDYKRCLVDNEHWTTLTITGIVERLNKIYNLKEAKTTGKFPYNNRGYL